MSLNRSRKSLQDEYSRQERRMRLVRVQRPIDSGDDTLANLLICTVKEDKTENEQQLLALEDTIKKSFGFGTTLLEIELKKCTC